MDVKELGDLFTCDHQEKAIAYLKEEGLYEEIEEIAKKENERISPNYNDLARLHYIICSRNVFTVLEFGVGFSSLVMADALAKNKAKYLTASDKPDLKGRGHFVLHTVDTGDVWINATKSIIPDSLKGRVKFYQSSVSCGTFQDRMCHYYDQMPDVVPDFVYMDGPDPRMVQENINGMSWSGSERLVMSGDLLQMENCLLPGALVLFDGRTANARFVEEHLYRHWGIYRNPLADVTLMELQEDNLGSYNKKVLDFQLGSRAQQWD